MAADGKKGITVKVDAALHAEITQYLQDHGMTMTEFVTLCNLRRTAATGAFASGHPAEPNGHLH